MDALTTQVVQVPLPRSRAAQRDGAVTSLWSSSLHQNSHFVTDSWMMLGYGAGAALISAVSVTVAAGCS